MVRAGCPPGSRAWCLRKQMDSAGALGSPKTLLPQGVSPAVTPGVAPAQRTVSKSKPQRVHSLCCGLGLRLAPGFTKTVSVSPPLNMAWPQTPSVSSKILSRVVYPWFSVILSFSPLAMLHPSRSCSWATPLHIVCRTTCCSSARPLLLAGLRHGVKPASQVSSRVVS